MPYDASLSWNLLSRLRIRRTLSLMSVCTSTVAVAVWISMVSGCNSRTEKSKDTRPQDDRRNEAHFQDIQKMESQSMNQEVPHENYAALTLSVEFTGDSRAVATITVTNKSSLPLDLPGFAFTRDVILKLRHPGGALCERTAEGRTKLSPESQFDGEPPPYFGTAESANVEYVLPGESKTWTVDLAKCFEFGKGRHTLQAAIRGALRTGRVAEEVYVKSNEVELDL